MSTHNTDFMEKKKITSFFFFLSFFFSFLKKSLNQPGDKIFSYFTILLIGMSFLQIEAPGVRVG